MNKMMFLTERNWLNIVISMDNQLIEKERQEMSRPYGELMKEAESNNFALAEKIYQLGRADQKKEDNAFFNFESAWELEKQKIRAAAIDEFVELITLPLTEEDIERIAEQLKVQKK